MAPPRHYIFVHFTVQCPPFDEIAIKCFEEWMCLHETQSRNIEQLSEQIDFI